VLRPQDVRDVLRVAGAEVLSCAAAPVAVDPAVAALDVPRTMLSTPGDADAPGRTLADVASADVGMLLDAAEAVRYPLARRALADGVPASGPAGPDASPLSVGGGWVLWVAPQVPEPSCLAVVGRRLNVRFAATEAARLRAFAGLLEQLRQVHV